MRDGIGYGKLRIFLSDSPYSDILFFGLFCIVIMDYNEHRLTVSWYSQTACRRLIMCVLDCRLQASGIPPEPPDRRVHLKSAVQSKGKNS